MNSKSRMNEQRTLVISSKLSKSVRHGENWNTNISSYDSMCRDMTCLERKRRLKWKANWHYTECVRWKWFQTFLCNFWHFSSQFCRFGFKWCDFGMRKHRQTIYVVQQINNYENPAEYYYKASNASKVCVASTHCWSAASKLSNIRKKHERA